MFGYTIPVTVSLSSKDASIYKGYYCETCHQLRDGYGVMSTIIVSYEMTFANIILNAVMDDGVKIEEPKAGQLCVFKHGSKHSELLRKLAAYTVLVANNALVDDEIDGGSVKSKFGTLWLNRSIQRARTDFHEYDELIMRGYENLREKEVQGCTDPYEMGMASARSMVDVMRIMNDEEWTPELEELFFNLGTWVYVLDAIDDLDEDFTKNHYNPFLAQKKEFVNGEQFIMDNIYDITSCINRIVGNIQASYLKIRPQMKYNIEIADNIIYQGIPVSVKRVLSGNSKLKPTLTDMLSGKINRSLGNSF